MRATLVLNADFTPLSCIPISSVSWKDAIKMCYVGSAKVVETYRDWEVHSPSTTIKVPSVVVSSKFFKKKNSVRFSRHSLLLRDNFSCQYCHDELSLGQMTIDHVIPKVRGGTTRWDNVVSACCSCNSLKGHRTTIRPNVMPIKPTHGALLNNARKLPIIIPDESWVPYIGWDEQLIKIVPPNKKIYTNLDD